MNDNDKPDDGAELDDNDIRLIALGLMLILVGLLYFFDIVPAAAQYGGPRMWGFERPEAYEAPPCNPRGRGYPYEGPRYQW